MNQPAGRRLLAWVLLGTLALPSTSAIPSMIEVNDTCTLVDAIHAANNDDDRGGLCPPGGSGPDTLVLTGNVTLTEVDNSTARGDSGLPEVVTDIIVEGGDFVIERAADAPDFRFFRMETYPATLTLRDLTLRNGATRSGGAISFRYTDLQVERVTLEGNATTGSGGAIGGSFGDLTITNSTLSGNSAGIGGATSTSYTTVEITNSTLRDNVATYRGGAIAATYGDVTVTNSTLSGNSTRRGGAFFVDGIGYLIVTNSTLSGNAASDSGGALWVDYATVYVTNSIVANTLAGDNCDDPVHVSVASFADDASCGAGFSPITPDADFDTTLADNGGPTLTHALLQGSVAQNAAGDCGLATDQRGVPRDDGACDSGSFELEVSGACCNDGPGIESECVLATRSGCEAEGGRFVGSGVTCDEIVDCTALLVTMTDMSAVAVAGGVRIRWSTALEVDTVGFRVLRQGPGGRHKGLDTVGPIVPSIGSEVDGGSYELLDDSPAAARAIHFFVEDIDLFGRVTRHGPIPVKRGGRRDVDLLR